ncbi:MAG: OmpH family outer membrane protein [Chitinophagaceae bacterium]|nr:OmpH family outer membrane protein [Chitinophagaceae bacterium]MCB9046630.1 OmpH family outer membrane protein [Chitinophagales bacterium]
MKKIVLIVACGLMLGNIAIAQTKFGHINSAELLKNMPDVTKAENEIQTYAKTFQEQLQAMSKEYETKVQAFQAGEKTMTEAMKEVKVKEIKDLEARIESTNQSAQEKVEKKRQELLQPIIDKADKAIKSVATEKGYDYIFDTSTGAFLQVKQSDDIMSLVKAKLGMQ